MIYKKLNVKSKPILFADDTNIIFTKILNSNILNITIEFEHLHKWF